MRMRRLIYSFMAAWMIYGLILIRTSSSGRLWPNHAVPIEKESYLGSTYHQGYKIQMDIYVYILRQMGYSVLIRPILWSVMGKNS